jgi:uncharacterized membrane protein YqiK
MAVAGGSMLAVAVAALVLYARSFARAESGHALVIHKPGRTDVSFTAALVLPIVHRAEPIDVRVKTLVVARRGKDALSCRDGVRVDVVARFHLRIQRTAEDVLKVAASVGCARAGDPATLEALFSAKLAEALATVAAHCDFSSLHADRQRFKDDVLAVLGADLSGYVLDDLVLDVLEQTPISSLDPNNILDARGLREVAERTTRENVLRTELELEARRQQLRFEHELQDLAIELERRTADALGRFRESTGRELTTEEVRARLEDGLRQVVERVLDERRDPAAPAR